MAEAIRLAGELRVPTDLDELDDDDEFDRESDRWNADVMEAAEELAFLAAFDAALITSAWCHMLRDRDQSRRDQPRSRVDACRRSGGHAGATRHPGAPGGHSRREARRSDTPGAGAP